MTRSSRETNTKGAIHYSRKKRMRAANGSVEEEREEDLLSVSGMELVMEELVEVMVLIEGLIPYTGYAPVIAAVWDTQAAGSMGRIGSPTEKEGCTCWGFLHET